MTSLTVSVVSSGPQHAAQRADQPGQLEGRRPDHDLARFDLGQVEQSSTRSLSERAALTM
jgi:hypothetical protein